MIESASTDRVDVVAEPPNGDKYDASKKDPDRTHPALLLACSFEVSPSGGKTG